MPSYVCKQPNGLLAVFSTVVDNFTAFDCTPEEAVECFLDTHGRIDAREKVKRGIEDQRLNGGPPGSGLDRWNEAIKTIEVIHGKKEVKSLRREYPGAFKAD